MVLTVCFELGKTEEEVAHWSLETLYRWMGYLRLRDELQASAIEKARSHSTGPTTRGGSVVIVD